jgi:DNA ligase (NAD+)
MNSTLIKFLDSASSAYYAGCPIIPDTVFDSLADSVGYDKLGAKEFGKTAKHSYPLYSLQKHYVKDGEPPLAAISVNEKSITNKIDGAAISLLYIDGDLVLALTRGDGKEGQVITNKILSISYIPKRINLPGLVQVNGEIAAPSHVENARNYAAGALNLKDASEFSTRALEFFAYGVKPYQKPTYEEDLIVLSKNKFKTVRERDIEKTYPTDGLVIRINNNAQYDSLGFTSKHPRGAYALKENQEAVESTILDVVWQVGKSGKVTPVAILEPVMIGDAEVSRATLNNQGFIEALDLNIGDKVFVIRSGEVIPCIIGKVEQ